MEQELSNCPSADGTFLSSTFPNTHSLAAIMTDLNKTKNMTKLLTTLLMLLATQCFSQTDHNGNPVFNSISINEDTLKDFHLLGNYYTLKNNIENKNSSVYISKRPTLKEIENAALNLPSDFYLVSKNQATLNLIMIVNKPNRQYFVVNPTTGKQLQFPCSIEGDITENRANEIIKEKYDPKANINGNKFFFNNKTLTIIPSEVIKKNILDLIEAQKLNIGDSSGVKIFTKEDLKKVVLKESRVNGKLDFFTEIKGHEMDGIQIKPGLFDTKIGIALYKWGRANFELGVNKVEDAFEFWAEYKGRPANSREKEYIKLGFDKELEK